MLIVLPLKPHFKAKIILNFVRANEASEASKQKNN